MPRGAASARPRPDPDRAGCRGAAGHPHAPKGRRWLRGARGAHADWLYQQGVQKVVAVDRDLLTRLAPQRTPLGWALNTLLGAAVAYRRVLGLTDPLWSLIGSFTRGHLLAPNRRT